MDSLKRFTTALTLAASILLSLPIASLHFSAVAFDASPTPQNVVGVWNGFFQDVEHTNYHPRVHLTITTQVNRRFDGELEVPGGIVPCYRVQGTVAASDNVSFVSPSVEANSAVGKSRLHDFGGGGGVLNGRLTLRFADGTKREGTLVLLRNFVDPPEPVVPSLSGDWRGTYTSEVTNMTSEMSAHFTISAGEVGPPSIIGEVTIIPCIFPEALVSIGAGGRVIVIAQGEGEHVILNGVLEQEGAGDIIPCYRGTYQMEHDDGLQDFGTFDIEKTVTGAGE